MKVKALGLLNACEHVRRTYGDDALRQVVDTCSPQVRDRALMSVNIEWHPVGELIEFLEVASTVLNVSSRELSRECGAASARRNTRGLVRRALFHLGTPTFLFNRIASMWGQYNDTGSMKLLHLNDKLGLIEVRDVPAPHAVFCENITGWAMVISEAIGIKQPWVFHQQCRARGDGRCIWRITWRKTASDKHESALQRLGETEYPKPPDI